MNVKGALFQPELIEIMRAIFDDDASRGEAHFGDESRDCVSHSRLCRKRRARPGSAENECSLGRRGMLALFARCLSGAPGGLSRTMSLIH
jgi:hypothetical protein